MFCCVWRMASTTDTVTLSKHVPRVPTAHNLPQLTRGAQLATQLIGLGSQTQRARKRGTNATTGDNSYDVNDRSTAGMSIAIQGCFRAWSAVRRFLGSLASRPATNERPEMLWGTHNIVNNDDDAALGHMVRGANSGNQMTHQSGSTSARQRVRSQVCQQLSAPALPPALRLQTATDHEHCVPNHTNNTAASNTSVSVHRAEHSRSHEVQDDTHAPQVCFLAVPLQRQHLRRCRQD